MRAALTFRFAAFLLILALSLPPPALALRTEGAQGAGLEEVRRALRHSAGLEESVADQIRRTVASDFGDLLQSEEVRMTYDSIRPRKEPWKTQQRIEPRQLLVLGPGGQVYVHLHVQLPYSSEHSWLDNGLLVPVSVRDGRLLFGDPLAEPSAGSRVRHFYFVPLKKLVPQPRIGRLMHGIGAIEKWIPRVKLEPLALDPSELKQAIEQGDCASVLGASVTKGEAGLFVMDIRSMWDGHGLYSDSASWITFKRLDRLAQMPDLQHFTVSPRDEALSLLLMRTRDSGHWWSSDIEVIGTTALEKEPRLLGFLKGLPPDTWVGLDTPKRFMAVLAGKEWVRKIQESNLFVTAESDPVRLFDRLRSYFGHYRGTIHFHATDTEVRDFKKANPEKENPWEIRQESLSALESGDLKGFFRGLFSRPNTVGPAAEGARTEYLISLLDEWISSLPRTGLEESPPSYQKGYDDPGLGIQEVLGNLMFLLEGVVLGTLPTPPASTEPLATAQQLHGYALALMNQLADRSPPQMTVPQASDFAELLVGELAGFTARRSAPVHLSAEEVKPLFDGALTKALPPAAQSAIQEALQAVTFEAVELPSLTGLEEEIPLALKERLQARPGMETTGVVLTGSAVPLARAFAQSNFDRYAVVVQTPTQASWLEELGVPASHIFVIEVPGDAQAYAAARAFLDQLQVTTIRTLSTLAAGPAAVAAQVRALLADFFEPVGPAVEQRLRGLVLQAQHAFEA